MRGRRNTRSRGIKLFATVMACGCSLVLGCRKASGPVTTVANAAVRVEDPATRELRAIGNRAVTALVARDVNALLEYDHNPEDEASLKRQNGELYCYLFDSSCIPDGKQRAVYEMFTTAPKLGIDVTVARVRGTQYGLLMFYDKSQISDEELYSPDFLCTERARRASTTWRFIEADGKWSTSTLFEYKTERPCQQAQNP
jgi:hypothetical protein